MSASSLAKNEEVVPGVPLPEGLTAVQARLWWRTVGAWRHLPGYAVDLTRCINKGRSSTDCAIRFLSPMIYRKDLGLDKEEFEWNMAEVIDFMITKKHIRLKDGRWLYLNRKQRGLQRHKLSRRDYPPTTKKHLRSKAKKRKKMKKCKRVQVRQRRNSWHPA